CRSAFSASSSCTGRRSCADSALRIAEKSMLLNPPNVIGEPIAYASSPAALPGPDQGIGRTAGSCHDGDDRMRAWTGPGPREPHRRGRNKAGVDADGPGGDRPRPADYRRSDRTACVEPFAWARAAMPDWFRMLNRVRLADSSAMLASRIRLSAALLFTICDCA